MENVISVISCEKTNKMIGDKPLYRLKVRVNDFESTIRVTTEKAIGDYLPKLYWKKVTTPYGYRFDLVATVGEKLPQ